VSRQPGRRPFPRERDERVQFPPEAGPRDVADERMEYVIAPRGMAMSLAADECPDDRPRATAQKADTFPHRTAASPPLPGDALRRQREHRGLTIDALADATKITKSTLRALENSDVLHLPAPIYTRGFVKAYAREVGLEPNRTADEYLRAIEPLRAHHLLVDDGALPPVQGRERRVDANDEARHALAENQVRRVTRLAALAAVAGVIVYLWAFSQRTNDAPPPPPALSDAAPASTPGDGATDAVPAALASAPLRLELAAHGPCWIAVRVDGRTVVARLFQRGESQTLDVADEAVIRAGEPGALSISINGEAGRTLGPSGRPVTVRITRDNFRDFLES
jgi:cytoskeleton protein RodZ